MRHLRYCLVLAHPHARLHRTRAHRAHRLTPRGSVAQNAKQIHGLLHDLAQTIARRVSLRTNQLATGRWRRVPVHNAGEVVVLLRQIIHRMSQRTADRTGRLLVHQSAHARVCVRRQMEKVVDEKLLRCGRALQPQLLLHSRKLWHQRVARKDLLHQDHELPAADAGTARRCCRHPAAGAGRS